jgi:steroid 5-alpha reductase family enzyme
MKAIRNLSRPASILISILIYTIAITVAVIFGQLYSDYHPLVIIGVGDLAATIIVFMFSVMLNNSSAYDPYWSVKPIVIAIAYIFIFKLLDFNTRQLIVILGTLLYALRLTSNFYRDWPGFSHEDWRYVNFRNSSGNKYWLVSFLAIHFFPTVMVYLGCISMFAIFSTTGNAFNMWDLLGFVVLFGSVIYAFVADEQMRRFRKNPENRGKAMTNGLWNLSRHPNYLGEISTWWGLFFFAFAAGSEYWWTIIGPVAITIMFIFASIPLIEKRNLERREGYAEYLGKTRMLIPFPIRKATSNG